MARQKDQESTGLADKTPVEIRQIARDQGIENADRYEKHELLDLIDASKVSETEQTEQQQDPATQ